MWEREFRKYERNKTYEVELDKLKPYTQYAVYVDVYYTVSIKNASRSSIRYTRTTVSGKLLLSFFAPLSFLLCMALVYEKSNLEKPESARDEI